MVTTERREATPVQLTIVARKPSQFQRVGFADFQLTELVRQARGNEDLSSKELLERVREEFGGLDSERVFYLKYVKRELVGAATFGLWAPDHSGEGGDFWRALEPSDELIEQEVRETADDRKDHIRALVSARRPVGRRARLVSPLALEIQRIFTLPSHHGEGVGSDLFEHAIKEWDPSIILALTQSPDAVIATKNISGRLGFRTFFGTTELGPNLARLRAYEHFPIRDAYKDSKHLRLQPSGVFYVDKVKLPPRIPQVDGLPFIIRAEFASIVSEQYGAKGKYAVVKPLISVRSEVLEAVA